MFELCDVTYTSDCDANLISLSQLGNHNIQYVNNIEIITLMQLRYSIAYVKLNLNIFILNLATPKQAMLAIKPNQSIYLVDKSKKFKV